MAGQVRMAEALLRSAGGRTVLLRIPAPAVPSEDAEQLGCATPLFTEVPLAPVVVLGTGELLVSAGAVERVVGSLALDSVEVLFRTAVGVVLGDEVWRVVSVVAVEAFGVAYLYRVRVVTKG